MRFRLRTLLIVMALGPPLIALAWWYGRAAIVLFLLGCLVCPELVFAAFGYGVGGLCHSIAKLPGGNDRKDARFSATPPRITSPPVPK